MRITNCISGDREKILQSSSRTEPGMSFSRNYFIFGVMEQQWYLSIVFTLNCSNIYRPTINSIGPNLKTALMTISSNHQSSKHDDVPNIMWTCICQLCIRKDQNASKKTKILLFWIHVYINLLKIIKSYCR
jgi:hypothetical protein